MTAHGGGNPPGIILWGVMDQRPVEERRDVLVYTLRPLQHDVEVAGAIVLHLFASTSARDTDWTAKLVDVSPDDYAMNLMAGILRARYPKSFEHPELLTPGKAYEFTIETGYTDNVFLKGHCIRLEVSSSNFPTFSRNTTTGKESEKDTRLVEAQQTVFHPADRASYLQVPLVTPGLETGARLAAASSDK